MKARFFLKAAFVLAGLGCSAGLVSAVAQSPAPVQGSWTWPVIPGCLSDPEIKTSGTTSYTSPICPLYDQLLASDETDVELKSARLMNWEMDGVLYPAFLPGTEVVTFIVSDAFSKSFTGQSRLVRVSTSAVAARSGSWWTTLATVSDNGKLMTPDEIRAKLALTGTPSCVAYADAVRSGVRGYMGVVAPAFDEPGGGAEFWFPPDAVSAKTVGDIPGGATCQ
jgi:hypothetical protein